MHENDRERTIRTYKDSHTALEADFTDEFFRDVEERARAVTDIGRTGRWKRFSDLSWVVEFNRIRSEVERR
ncbi:MAG: hypothetical protein MI724_05450 [Spirochaetales bacterium]|nr:hypothetical protein [Spirochaetales bacterium]